MVDFFEIDWFDPTQKSLYTVLYFKTDYPEAKKWYPDAKTIRENVGSVIL